jgi:hypothetical protein
LNCGKAGHFQAECPVPSNPGFAPNQGGSKPQVNAFGKRSWSEEIGETEDEGASSKRSKN